MLILLCVFVVQISHCYAENVYLLCRTLANINLRAGPSVKDPKICQIPKNAYFVAIIDDESPKLHEGDFVYGLYIDKDVYGYACVDYLDEEKELETDRGGILSKAGNSYGYDPEVEITNDTNRNITVQINGTNFPFSPHQIRTITCAPGSVSILASSPGVIPYSATDYVSENSLYTWKFYIKTRYR